MGRRKEFLEEAVALLAKEGLKAVLLGVIRFPSARTGTEVRRHQL